MSFLYMNFSVVTFLALTQKEEVPNLNLACKGLIGTDVF